MTRKTKGRMARAAIAAITTGNMPARSNAIICMTEQQCKEANEKILWHGKALYVSVAAAMDIAHSHMKDIMYEERGSDQQSKRLRYRARWCANTAWQRLELYMEQIKKYTKSDEKLYCDILDELDTATESMVEELKAKTSTILVANGVSDPFFKARMETICMMLDLAKTIYKRICIEVVEDTGLMEAGKMYRAYDPEPIRKWWEEATINICRYEENVRNEIAASIQATLDQLYDRVVHTSDLMDNVAAKHPEAIERYENKIKEQEQKRTEKP